jgi:hypothetical protein
MSVGGVLTQFGSLAQALLFDNQRRSSGVSKRTNCLSRRGVLQGRSVFNRFPTVASQND